VIDKSKESFYFCEKCGKKLIKRLPNGLWHFCFGRRKWMSGDIGNKCPVNIYVHGSIRMQCLSDTCRHINTFTYFPATPINSEDNDSDEETVQ
jgi:hypothetical protein